LETKRIDDQLKETLVWSKISNSQFHSTFFYSEKKLTIPKFVLPSEGIAHKSLLFLTAGICCLLNSSNLPPYKVSYPFDDVMILARRMFLGEQSSPALDQTWFSSFRTCLLGK